MELSRLYSNTFSKIVKFKRSLAKKDNTITETSSGNNSLINNITNSPIRKTNNCGDTEVVRRTRLQKNLTRQEIEDIANRYLKGETTYDLAEQFGCARTTISAALKKYGIIGVVA